jgi:ribonuclease J
MGVSICIHRAAQEIGGNCVEIKASSGARILLDAGRPLDTPEGEPTPIPATLDTTKPVSGVLLSHAHADHCGLLETLPAAWPVYCGKATERLLHLSAAMGRKTLAQTCVHWENGKVTTIGPFTVTPHLIDHSAFDAYALQIDVEGKTIVYSGDFRAHGRKAALTEGIMRTPPKRVDVLIMEGTNLSAADAVLKPTLSEAELEEQFASLFRECTGRVFVSWASTNIDRAVTLYKACKQSGRVLVPDLHCMLVLMRLKEFAQIPQPEWRGGHMRAVVTKKMMRWMERFEEPGLIEYLKRHRAAMSADKLLATPEKWVIMARSSLVDDYRKKGVVPTQEDTWVWSMWNGYLERESTLPMREFFAPCQKAYIHSSGHASPDILRRFAEAMQPKALIPIHGGAWKDRQTTFANFHMLQNGECFVL